MPMFSAFDSFIEIRPRPWVPSYIQTFIGPIIVWFSFIAMGKLIELNVLHWIYTHNLKHTIPKLYCTLTTNDSVLFTPYTNTFVGIL